MADARLDAVIEQVKSLSTEQQREVRKLLDGLLYKQPASTPEDDLERQLLEAGLLCEIKLPITDLTSYRDRKPIAVKFKPLSEIIVEERR